MEIIKSILLASALAGMCLLENTILFEGCKIVIFILACIVSYDIFISGIKGIKDRMITDGLPMVLPMVLTLVYGMIYWVKMVLDKHEGLVDANGLYITVIIGMLTYRVVMVLEKLFNLIRKKKSGAYIKKSSEECVKYSEGKGVKVKKSEIEVGDIVVLRHGEEIFFDGVVIKGESVVYEGICLNKRYVKKTPKEEVYAGSINCDGAMYVKVTAVGDNTVLGNDLKEIRKSKQYKKTVARSVDTINGIAFILQLVCMVLVFWLFVFNKEILLGIRQATLATCIMMPVMFYVVRFITDVYSFIALRKKIFINGDVKEIMEGAAQIKSFIIDYDDVLTVGDETIVDVYSDQLEKEKVLQLGCMAVSKAKGLSYRALSQNAMNSPYTLEGFKEYIGKGVDGAINPGRLIVSVGSKEYMVEKGISTFEFADKATKAKTQGKRVLYIAVNKKLEGIVCLACKIDKGACEMISNLKEQGLEGKLLTKDTKEVAAYYGKEFGIDKAMGDMMVRNKLDMLDEMDMKGRVLVIANGTDNGELLGTATVSVATSENYKEVIRVSDCIVKEENKKYIATLIGAGKRYCTFISSMIILSIAILLMCTLKMSGIEDLIGLKSMALGNNAYGEWGICIAWAMAGLIALLFAIIVDMIKKKK